MSISRLIPALALTLLITPVLNSQDPYSPDDNPVNPEMQRQEIINLERETARAILLNNGTFFRRVYAEDFAGTLSHGQTVDKAHLINEVQNGAARYQSFNVSDIQVRIFRETAVATCLWTSRGFFRGQQADSQMRVMHVYINGPRGWHVVAGQTTALPPYTLQPL
jgi:ketosteroid isomerase-like protein